MTGSMGALEDADTVVIPLGVGSRFADRYEIIGVLGEGGMGAVYRVRDHELGEVIALKVLRAEIAETEGALERFRREAKLARKVTHPNVARTFDLGTHDGLRFLTMELIEGEPLSRTLSRGRLPLSESLRIGAEIARGLAAAHAVGVVHRDLKPDNVMVAGTRVAITDFGIARQTGVVGDAAHSVGIVLGTPAYMAPEQVEGRELDGRADIYALGIVLYQMLTGELPFAGDTPFAMAAARLHGDVPDPVLRDPTLPGAIAAVVRTALARKREDRPDAQMLVEKLDELRAGRFAHVDPISTVVPTSVGAVGIVSFGGELGGAISEAVADSASSLRGARVIRPGSIDATAFTRDGVLDALALARSIDVAWVVSGSIRVAGNLARVALRLFDARANMQPWHERFDAPADPFALEDRVVAKVSEALRERVQGERRVGPADPAAAELYQRARKLYMMFAPGTVAQSVKLLEEAHARFPTDSWITGALAAALVRSWMFQPTTDRSVVARAEEMALRALAADPNRGEALLTIGIIRWQFGELAAAARAFEDAIARTPNLAEAHEYLGMMLAEAGHTDAAFRQLETAISIDIHSARGAYGEKLRLLSLLGEQERVDREIANVLARDDVPPLARAFMPLRFATWRRDADTVERSYELIKTLNEAERAYYEPLMSSLVAALRGRAAKDVMRERAEMPHASLRRRSYFYQLSAEYQMLVGDHHEALVSLERGADLLLFDILWLDRCPLFAPLRDDPRFARVRGICGARAASIFR
jgi:eukaryotic-like serine/threonine-protein kinase